MMGLSNPLLGYLRVSAAHWKFRGGHKSFPELGNLPWVVFWGWVRDGVGVGLQEDQRLWEVGERDGSMPPQGWGNWGRSPPFLMGKGELISHERAFLRGPEESRENSSWKGKPLPSPCSQHLLSVGTAVLLIPLPCLILGGCVSVSQALEGGVGCWGSELPGLLISVCKSLYFPGSLFFSLLSP